MNHKKRILSLILMLMIAVCCMTEAVMIRNLRNDKEDLQGQIDTLSKEVKENTSGIDDISDQVKDVVEAGVPQIYLPEDLYVCAGLTVELYNENICSGVDSTDYDFYWSCDIGDCMSDKFRIEADTADVGDYPVTVTAYDYRMNELASASTMLHVLPNVFLSENTGEIQTVVIGDSLSNGTEWMSYTRLLSGDKMCYVGTLGAEENLMSEGYAGICAGDFLKGTLYGNSAPTALFNTETGEFDWNYYKEKTGISPDVVEIFLGTNLLELDPGENVDNIMKIAEKIHEDDPELPILVMTPVYPASQDGMASQQNTAGFESMHGMWSLERSQMVFNLMKTLGDAAKERDYITFVPSALTFDRIYGFNTEQIKANPHTEVTETVPSGSIYPADSGYAQIGDSVYSALCYLISNHKIDVEPEEQVE